MVLDLVDKASLRPGCFVFFDNLFTSFPLLTELSRREMGGTGTVRWIRYKKLPIMQKKEMEKKTVPRGEIRSIFKEDKTCVAWKDNKAVYIASNIFGVEPVTPAKRFSR